jgi:tetratricopeptide (TPR) repeat protein
VLRKSLELAGPNLSIVRKLYALLAQGHWQAGQHAVALAACAEGLARYPDDAELLYQQGLLLSEVKDLDGARVALEKLLQTRQGKYFDMVDVGLRGHKARHQLAGIHRAQGRAAEAEDQWKQALAERPDFGPARLGLAELFLDQKRWGELDEALAHLEGDGRMPLEAALVRARGQLERQEFAQARQCLEEAVACWPGDLRARVLLTHALVREGQDWPALEAALREVLRREPAHAEARHNLEVLLRRLGREAELEDTEKRLSKECELAGSSPAHRRDREDVTP